MSDRGEPAIRGLAFFGGGTGGHIYPGIAVAERARARFPDCRIVFFRTTRSVEDRVFEGTSFEIRPLEIRPPGRSPLAWLRYLRAARRARAAIRQELRGGGWVGLGLGGYASLPGILAARRQGAPVILLEQNRVPGRVNRLFSRFVDAVSCAYPETGLPGCRRRVVTGNPVRESVLRAAAARDARGPCEGRRTVLVFGGSQGAHGINQRVHDALAELSDLLERIRWIHIAGHADKDYMTEAYRRCGWEAEVLSYSQDLPGLMARSDLALCRAGGTTLAELTVVGLPSILVPYPHHRDAHQTWNAQALVERGGARVLNEAELNAESLRQVFEDVLFVPDTLEAWSRSARSLARPDASDAVLDLAVDLRQRCQPDSERFS